MSNNIDFEVARKSGLRQRGELDKVFGVSYPMVNRYLTGKSFPRGKQRRLISEAINVLSSLIEKGTLPFKEDRTEESRATAVEKISAYVAAKAA